MTNLFDLLKTHEDNLTKDYSTKNYWELFDTFNSQARAIDGSIVNERDVYDSIKNADRKRLLKFG
jgi:hypothetical protein